MFKIKFIALCLTLALLGAKSYAQPSIAWQRCYGTTGYDGFTDAILTPDFGFLTTIFYGGTDGDAEGIEDLLYPAIVIKFDSNFVVEWQKEFGGSFGSSNFLKILTTSNGYVYGGFTSADDGHFTENNGGRDLMLVKTDFLGGLMWSHCYGGPGDNNFTNALVASDGGFILTGTANFAGGDIPFHYGDGMTGDAVVMKIDSVGEVEWVKNLGGSSYDGPIGDCLEIETGVYQIHIHSASNDFDLAGTEEFGEQKRLIVNLDNEGNIVKQNVISATADLTFYDGSTYLVNNRVMVVGAGNTTSLLYPAPIGHSLEDGAIAFFDEDLELSEMYQWGGGNSDLLVSSTIDSINNYYFIGQSLSNDYDLPGNYNGGIASDFWMLKTDSSFNKLWSINFGGSFNFGETYGGSNSQTILFNKDYVYYFGSCMVPDTLPDFDIECGHQSELPGWAFTDAWIVCFSNLSDNIIEHSTNDVVEIFPNPTNDILNIKVNVIDAQQCYVQLFNLVGNLILDGNFNSLNSKVFDLTALPIGLYIIKIQVGESFYFKEKIIVQH